MIFPFIPYGISTRYQYNFLNTQGSEIITLRETVTMIVKAE
jgi:hypothetical protein